MDALAFLRERTKTRLGRVLFCVLCLMPPVGGLVGHLIGRKSGLFMDVDAVLCAARTEALGGSPYGLPNCPGMAPAPYVYAPQVAGWLAPLIRVLGIAGAHWAYILCLFLPASALLLWYAVARPIAGADWRVRMLGLSCLAPMALCSGNFGIVMHAVVISSLLVWPRRNWVFLAVVLACVVIKPTFLLYLLVPLFEARPWRQRLVTVGVSGIASIGVLAVTSATAGPLSAQWQAALRATALHDQPGLGWFAFVSDWLYMAPDAPGTLILTAVFMAAMTASGVAIAEMARLDADERKVLALGLVPLLTPRLMDYDMLAVVPMMTLLVRLAPVLGGRIYRYNVTWLYVGVLGFGVITNVLHVVRQWPRSYADAAVFCLLVLIGGGGAMARILALRRLKKGRGPRERKKREKATLGGPLHIRRLLGGEDARETLPEK